MADTMMENRSGPNKIVALVMGIGFVAVGLLGFVSNPILGIFGTNLTHNLVHLLSGVVLLALWWYAAGAYARVGNIVFGVVYLLVSLLGFAGTVVPTMLNTAADGFAHADDSLHLALGVVFLAVALIDRTPVEGRRTMPTR